MSAYTIITTNECQSLLAQYDLGNLIDFEPILAGVTNSIYRLTTDSGAFVLTLFEELAADELPFYLDLTRYCSERGVLCPTAIADKQGEWIHHIQDKPCIVVPFFAGETLEDVTPLHCAQVGKALGELHLAAQHFPDLSLAPRGLDWCYDILQSLPVQVPEAERELLRTAYYDVLEVPWDELPQGIIHADLFRDNVLFQDDKLNGLLDFYYAGVGVYAVDLAICVNDWCLQDDFTYDEARYDALIESYQEARSLTPMELDHWPQCLERAALRFYASRLNDFYQQTASQHVQVKSPDYFKRLLIRQPWNK
jgi:homoserine kinase type II